MAHMLHLGNAKMMQDRAINIDEIIDATDELRSEGQTVMYVAIENKLAGYFERL